MNTADTGDFSGLPSGWTTPAGGGKELVTTYTVDRLGRPTSALSPNEQPATAYQSAGPDYGYSTQYVYIDGNSTGTAGYVDQIFLYPGWHAIGGGNYSTTGPVQVSRQYLSGNVVTGTAGSGSTTTLTDSTGLTASSGYIGLTLAITAGTDAGLTASVTGYNASSHQITFWPAFASAIDSTSHYTLSTPVYAETLSFTAPTDSTSTPSGSETISSSNIQSLSRGLTNNAGQLVETDDYSSLSGLTYSASAAIVAGASAGSNLGSGNYSATQLAYDSQGRLNRTVDPNGTISRTVYDGQGRVVSTYVGTNDTPGSGYWSPTNNTSPSNMIDTADYVYDGGGVGDSNLTQLTTHVDTSSSDDRVTQSLYDFRDRLVAQKMGVQASESDGTHRPITYYVIDNRGEVVRTYQYDGDGVSLSDFSSAAITDAIPTADASKVRALTVDSYDDQGRVYQSQLYQIDQANGTSGLTDAQILALPNLAANTFYNHRGDVMAVFNPGGQVTKSVYDGADRLAVQYTSDGGAVGNSDVPLMNWSAASTVQSDIVLSQTEYTYDGDGNVISTVQRERAHDASGTGDLRGGAAAVPGYAQVLGRDLFYNNSSYDGNNTAINSADDSAIDTSKAALLPGQSESPANVTGSSLGIDGIMIDITGLVGTPTASDFIFRVGTTGDPSTWSTAPAPSAIGVRSGAGTGGSSRVEITWANGTIVNEWLQVTVKADSVTGLAGADVFYYGDLRSDENGDGTVNSTDYAQVVADYGHSGVPVTQGDDYDKDGTVDSADFALVVADYNHSLPMITTPVQARSYYSADYYDAIDRLTDDVIVGTNGGSAYTRPSSAPSRSDAVLVNHTDYNNAGDVADTVDPRGIQNNFTYDLLGQTLEEVDGYSGPASSGKSQTDYTYDGNGDVLSLKASFPGTTLASQTTDYDYNYTAGTIGSSLFSKDLVSDVKYPDPSTGVAGGSSTDNVTYAYDLQAETTSMTDRDGSTHTYTYDVLGRLKLDAVTTLGSGVDGSIRALGYSYNGLGLPYQQTSYSDSGGTTVVNQVQDVYNGYGQLITQYQEHSGSVNTSSSLKVQYGYSQPTGANYSRLSTVTYPNGRVLDYMYNSGLDSDISRVSGISDAAGTGAGNDQSYLYLGLDTIVQATDGNGIALSYIKQPGDTLAGSDAGDQYVGLDRFGRVVDQNWVNTSTGVSTDRFQYGYDRDGNALYKNNLVNSTFSELYHANSATSGDDNSAYDNLNRLQGFRRGTLSASANNGGVLDTVSTLNTNTDSSQSWALDALGNQTSVTTDGTATGRTVNDQNQITAVGSTSLAYDNNGNLTTDQNGHTLVYNAWGQLVAMKNGSTTLASYVYDADGYRIQVTESSATTDLYYAVGNVIEERQAGTVTAQNVWGLTYVNQLVLRDDNSSSGSYGASGSGLGRRIYAQQDVNWNVISLVSSTGTVLQRANYTPYGIQTILSASWGSATDAYGVLYGYQGGRLDPVTGLVRFDSDGAGRDVSPTLGRPVEQDPTGTAYVNGANLYQWDLSGPASLVDPTGLEAAPPQGARPTPPSTQPTTGPATQPSNNGPGFDGQPGITIHAKPIGKPQDFTLRLHDKNGRYLNGIPVEAHYPEGETSTCDINPKVENNNGVPTTINKTHNNAKGEPGYITFEIQGGVGGGEVPIDFEAILPDGGLVRQRLIVTVVR